MSRRPQNFPLFGNRGVNMPAARGSTNLPFEGQMQQQPYPGTGFDIDKGNGGKRPRFQHPGGGRAPGGRGGDQGMKRMTPDAFWNSFNRPPRTITSKPGMDQNTHINNTENIINHSTRLADQDFVFRIGNLPLGMRRKKQARLCSLAEVNYFLMLEYIQLRQKHAIMNGHIDGHERDCTAEQIYEDFKPVGVMVEGQGMRSSDAPNVTQNIVYRAMGPVYTHSIWSSKTRSNQALYMILKMVDTTEYRNNMRLNPDEPMVVTSVVSTTPNTAIPAKVFQFVPWMPRSDLAQTEPGPEDLLYTDNHGVMHYGIAIRVGFVEYNETRQVDASRAHAAVHNAAAGKLLRSFMMHTRPARIAL